MTGDADAAPLVWVIGRGLVGGAAVAAAVGRAHRIHEPATPIPWTDPAAAGAALEVELARMLDHAGGAPWSVIWSAGTGVIGTSERALAAETETLERFASHLRAAVDAGPSLGSFVLTSSAAVYAGSSHPPFDESTAPAPRNAYGAAKLDQESVVRARFEGALPATVARVSTVYGPGQDVTKPQGLISQLCLRILLRRPVRLFVPLDTLRDYVFSDDVGYRLVQLAEQATRRVDARTEIRVVASDHAVPISTVLRTVQDVARARIGREQPVVAGASGHVHDLRVRSRHRHVDAREPTSLHVGVSKTYEDLAARLRRGELARADLVGELST